MIGSLGQYQPTVLVEHTPEPTQEGDTYAKAAERVIERAPPGIATIYRYASRRARENTAKDTPMVDPTLVHLPFVYGSWIDGEY